MSLLIAAVVSGLAAGSAHEASWQYRRSVEVSGEGELASLAVPLDVARHAQPGLRDLRLVAEDGTEIPYVIDQESDGATFRVASWRGRLHDQRQDAKTSSVWVVDFDEARTFDRIQLEIPQWDFAKRLEIAASEDGKTWRSLQTDAGIFEREWGGRLRHTAIDLPSAVTTRWLRITADDRRSKPVTVTSVTALATRSSRERSWSAPVAAELVRSEAGASRYRLDLPPGTPLSELEIEADDPAFARTVTLYDVRSVNGRPEEIRVSEKRLYRLRLADEALAVADVALPITSHVAGELVLVVRDGDSPPLRRLRAEARGPMVRLVFPTRGRSFTLFYGNPRTRAPLYDIDALRARLSLSEGGAVARVGAEAVNASFAPPAPLPMVTSLGAAVEPWRWRSMRPLTVRGAEDIFTIVLGPEDLAHARNDLADLRVVDAQDRQVPYILAAEAAEERVTLAFQPALEPAEEHRRALVLTVPEGSTQSLERLPLTALEIEVTDSFFSRPARIVAPGRKARREPEVVAATTLARRQAPGSAEPGPCRIALDGRRRAELRLEIDEGDNAPLAIREVRGIVLVPRVAFKAKPGEYRLLVGNDEARAPQYDLATLRQEVLAYSAVPTAPGPLEPNRGYRRTSRDYLTHAPRAAVLWGALLLAIVGLLALTVRILRSPPAA